MTAQKIKQSIGQIEKTIDDVAPFLSAKEFSKYCDQAHKLISKWKQVEREFIEKDKTIINFTDEQP